MIYVGLLQGKECADAYAAMDVFIFTSLSDTQGLVLSEAMAAGNPVFALDATGARDMIVHGKTGILLPAETSAHEFSTEMERVIADEKLFLSLQKNAATAAQDVSTSVCTTAMLELYADVIRQKGIVADEHLSRWEKLCKQWRIEVELVQEKLGCL